MTQLRDCQASLQSGSTTTCHPQELLPELSDIDAYHKWLEEHMEEAPFATTVILHNLVTGSIKSLWFLRGGKQRFACVRDAAAAAQRLLGFKGDALAMPTPSMGVPGIGKHSLINC